MGAAVCYSTVSEAILEQVLTEESHMFVCGIMTDGQSPCDEREKKILPKGTKYVPPGIPPIVSCQKGSKGFQDTTPNQDNYSLTYFKNGWTLACTFDGSGESQAF